MFAIGDNGTSPRGGGRLAMQESVESRTSECNEMADPCINPNHALLISCTEIDAKVTELAGQIDRDHSGKSPVVVGILKGAFMFLADLIRQMETPIKSVEFIRVSSYGASTATSGQPKMVVDLAPEAVEGEDVIVVEDIVDTGLSTQLAMEHLRTLKPASLVLCSLLDKPSRRRVPVTANYIGFTLPDKFVVGYGLDAGELDRQLPDIYTIED